jgi:hypothetical protein
LPPDYGIVEDGRKAVTPQAANPDAPPRFQSIPPIAAPAKPGFVDTAKSYLPSLGSDAADPDAGLSVAERRGRAAQRAQDDGNNAAADAAARRKAYQDSSRGDGLDFNAPRPGPKNPFDEHSSLYGDDAATDGRQYADNTSMMDPDDDREDFGTFG